MALWTEQAGLARAEAERRVAELLLIASDRAGALAGISTAYLARSEQLRADVWQFRVFVTAAHRRSGLAGSLAVGARDLLVRRHIDGHDRRGIGVMFVVQSEPLKRFVAQAVWRRTEFAFIGETGGGHHLRVYYFPGARAPEPSA